MELYLERIGRLDPALNSYRIVMAERALADADQADARRRGGDVRALLGVPLAVKDTEDVAGEVTRWGTAAFTEAAERGRRAGVSPAVGRGGGDREDEPSGAGDHRLHRGPRLRRDAQSLGPRRDAGRIERRQRGGRGRRPGRRGHRVRRGRLHPHPRGQLRPRGPQATARPHPAEPVHGALARHERARLRDAQRGGHRACSWTWAPARRGCAATWTRPSGSPDGCGSRCPRKATAAGPRGSPAPARGGGDR